MVMGYAELASPREPLRGRVESYLRVWAQDFPGGPVANFGFPLQGAQVWSLVGELDPTCCNWEFTCHN